MNLSNYQVNNEHKMMLRYVQTKHEFDLRSLQDEHEILVFNRDESDTKLRQMETQLSDLRELCDAKEKALTDKTKLYEAKENELTTLRNALNAKGMARLILQVIDSLGKKETDMNSLKKINSELKNALQGKVQELLKRDHYEQENKMKLLKLKELYENLQMKTLRNEDDNVPDIENPKKMLMRFKRLRLNFKNEQNVHGEALLCNFIRYLREKKRREKTIREYAIVVRDLIDGRGILQSKKQILFQGYHAREERNIFLEQYYKLYNTYICYNKKKCCILTEFWNFQRSLK